MLDPSEILKRNMKGGKLTKEKKQMQSNPFYLCFAQRSFKFVITFLSQILLDPLSFITYTVHLPKAHVDGIVIHRKNYFQKQKIPFKYFVQK